MNNVIDFAAHLQERRVAKHRHSYSGAIHFEHQNDGTYCVTYEGIYAAEVPVAAEHLADALLQLTIEMRGT